MRSVIAHGAKQDPAVLDAVALVWYLSRGTVLAKFDLHTGFSLSTLKTTPCWQSYGSQRHFMDTALPFELPSAPKIFSTFADELNHRNVFWHCIRP